jgi:hypothetical protein
MKMKEGTMKAAVFNRALRLAVSVLSVMVAAMVLTGCEDIMTPIVQEDVRLAELPIRLLTIQPPTNGSASPSGQVEVKDGEPFALSASAEGGFTFVYWEKLSGDGDVTFADETSQNTTVRLSGGNATIHAVISATPRNLTMAKVGEGTTTPVTGTVVVGDDIAFGIVAAPNTALAYTFGGWTQTGGGGVANFANAAAASTTVTLTGGDAQITATFLTPYTLTMSAQTGGYTNPSGNRAVPRDTPVAIIAYAYPTYRFTGWTQVSGTVTFGNPASASSTVTVSGGNATIRANFTKETVTLEERGSYYHGEFSTVPNEANDAYLYNGYLYLVGEGVTGSGVVRRWNVSTPTAPTSANNDYYYLTGIARAITGNGTKLFIGTDTRLYSVDIAGFDPSPTTTNISQSVRDVSLDTSSAFYGIRSGNTITGYYASNLSSGNMITDSDGWYFDYLVAVPGGVVVVHRRNGAHQLAAYYALIGDTQGVTSPDSSLLLHNGVDMDPGWAGKPVQDVDREYVIVPVEDENNVAMVRFYDVTALNDIQHVGSATLSKKPKRLAVDTSGSNDYYVFAIAGSGNGATVYVIDMWSKSSPVVRTTLNIGGFNSANAIAVHGNYLYVVVNDPTSGTNYWPTVKVFEIVKN